MTQMTKARGNLFAQVLDPANRANPYPLYAQLRATPVALQADGTYVVSTYREIDMLLHDPRISSDTRKNSLSTVVQAATHPDQEHKLPFIFLDPPDHDQLRRLVMHQFTPTRIAGIQNQIAQLVDRLLDAHSHDRQIDIVDDVAYPLPVTVICDLLGVPQKDEPRFHAWATALVRSLDPAQSLSSEEVQQATQAVVEMNSYFSDLINTLRTQPGNDLLSGLVAGNDPAGRMDESELIATARLLLIAGHETTVNLITNSMLTLLRHPNILEQLRRNPELVITLVEEVLRFEPPVQFRTRTTLTAIEIAGVTIPQGALVALLLASGSRDPGRFADPDRFDPNRADNEHLGFGGGIHYCVGAPLARIEAQIALNTLVRRLIAPRLAVDPPPYRENAALRGPRHLLVNIDRMEN